MKYYLDKIQVSSKLDDTIKSAIEKGYRQRSRSKAKSKWKKQIAAAAAVAIIGITAFGAVLSYPG